jgi:hypothetical protein
LDQAQANDRKPEAGERSGLLVGWVRQREDVGALWRVTGELMEEIADWGERSRSAASLARCYSVSFAIKS